MSIRINPSSTAPSAPLQTLSTALAELARQLEQDPENPMLQNQFVVKAQEACRRGSWGILKPYEGLLRNCRNFKGKTLLEWAESAVQDNVAGSVQILREVSSIVAQTTSRERLIQKLAPSRLGFPRILTVNWMHARIFTPGGLCGYRDASGLKFFSFGDETRVKLYRSGNNSQGLIIQKSQVVAASVWSGIKTTTQRRHEARGTFVQYDKTRVEQEGADFTVDPTNYRGWVNYQGGHLIDHKYSAANSHTDSQNYIPAHYFYNAPLKEHLVQRCEAYIEIPLYTPKPPRIGVKGQREIFHPIPVGIIFVQISNRRIKAAYYFPNNDFDYKGLKDSLGIEKDLAATMVPYFKLEECFHQLLHPAIITNLDAVRGGREEQSTREEHFLSAMSTVCHGMSLADCDEEEDIISRLSFGILHKKGAVDPALCLACDEEDFEQIEDQPLGVPFRALGEFLVRYGIGNALKSEALSVKSRLVFVNVIIDFIEANSEVSEEALHFVDSLAEEFKASLKELYKIKHTMALDELIYLANTYQRLSSQFNHPFSLQDHAIYGYGDLYKYFKKSMKVLFIIVSKHSVNEFNADLGMNLLNFIIEAQAILDYLIQAEFEEEDFVKEGRLLKNLRSYAEGLLARQESEDGIISAEFQINIGRAAMVKTRVSYLEHVIGNLGIEVADN